VKVKIYVEGGGDTRALKTSCRRGFRQFFERAGFKGRMPSVVACGSRNDAFDRFQTAVAMAGNEDFPLLLVDSERPVDANAASWDVLPWSKPSNAKGKQAHLMVQCMESWFLADRDQLNEFFGQGFSENALPTAANIEDVSVDGVIRSLKTASRNTSKGEYKKGPHSFDLLGMLDPDKIRAASNRAEQLFQILDEKC